MSTSPTTTLHLQDLQDLHDRYVAAINLAVSHDDLALVAELSAGYDAEAMELISAAA